MPAAWDWASGQGLLGLDDPEEWDAAFERGEAGLGTAVIGLAFHCTPSRMPGGSCDKFTSAYGC
jgi:hypothetical protein